MANLNEIKNAVREIKKFHSKIIILHCVSNYPTKLEDANLKRIIFLKKVFKRLKIGLSDHTNDIYSSIAAQSYGVVVIEKHFNIDKKKTPDSDFSILPNQLKKLSEVIKNLAKSNKKKFTKNHQMINLRRSIFASKDIKRNDKLSFDNIDTYRPNIGIPAENYFRVIGKKVKKNIKKNDPIYFSNLI